MKKVVIVFFTMGFLFAQGVGYGIKGGLNIPSFSEDDKMELEGFIGGFTINVDAILVELDIEANYVANKHKDSDMFITQLQLPATARISLMPTLYLRAGVQYSLILSAENGLEQDIKNDLSNGMDIVVGAGLSLDLPVIPELLIDVRYIIPTYDTYSKSGKLNQVQLTLGIGF